MSYVDVAVTMLFMSALIGAAGYGAAVYARWLNLETKREIEKKFEEFRSELRSR